MRKAALTLAMITLSSAVGLAKTLAKMEVVCVANEDQNFVRTVYVTTDKVPLIADPVGSLLIVDSVDQPNNETVVLTAKSEESTEVLSIKANGEATFSVTANNAIANFTMKCFANGAMKGLQLK